MRIHRLFTHCMFILFILAVAGSALGQVQPTWMQVTTANSPGGRSYTSMAYDAAHQEVVLFGGLASSSVSETWVWDGTNWTRKSPVNVPPARYLAAMAYDVERRQVVLFGGLGQSGGSLSDTWAWDGTNWTQKLPANSPPPRDGHVMAYDALHRQVVLFGGYGESGPMSDTWVWDGTGWTQKLAATSPPARSQPMMAYDLTLQQTVLFGGVYYGHFLSDTWIWDGANWTQKQPSHTPPARSDASMAYDAAHRQMVLFGGYSSIPGLLLGDTWIWDGADWFQQSPTLSPPARYTMAMAYDAASQSLVLFGGYDTTGGYASGTWLYSPGLLEDLVLTLSAAPNPATFGQPVTLTATLSLPVGTGTVTFYDGVTVIGAAPVVGGAARLTTIALPAGANSLHAYYGGDITNPRAISSSSMQTVNAVASSTFVTPVGSPIRVGLAPFAAVVADFNGDNKADLAVVNAAGGNVTVLLGNGSGGFAPAPGSPFATGNGPFSLAVGDFNNDGNPDLAVANSADNTVTILLGNGSGGFTPASGSPFAAGSAPISIAVADFNRDGIADLALANAGDNSVTVWLGNGRGGFTSAGGHSLPDTPTYLVAQDFMGGGLTDLVVALGTRLSVLGGGGDGSFQILSNWQFAFSGLVTSLAVGDLNGTGFSGFAATVFPNQVVAFDRFSPSFYELFPAGASPESVAIGDFNGDGKLDLAVANSDSNSVTLLLGNGRGAFAPLSPLPAGGYPFCVVVGEFNGDGRADLALVNFIDGTVTILLGK
jgi:hypothetical protein